MTLGKHAAVVTAIMASSQALVAVSGWLDGPGRSAVAFGAVVAGVNAILSHVLMRRSEGRSTRVFLKVVLGGMAGRMLLVLAAVLAGLLLLDLPRLPLLVSLLAHFVVFLALEMVTLHAAQGSRAEA